MDKSDIILKMYEAMKVNKRFIRVMRKPSDGGNKTTVKPAEGASVEQLLGWFLNPDLKYIGSCSPDVWWEEEMKLCQEQGEKGEPKDFNYFLFRHKGGDVEVAIWKNI